MPPFKSITTWIHCNIFGKIFAFEPIISYLCGLLKHDRTMKITIINNKGTKRGTRTRNMRKKMFPTWRTRIFPWLTSTDHA